MYRLISRLPRGVKKVIMLCVDALLVPLALFAVVLLQQSGGNGEKLQEDLLQNWMALPMLMSLCLLLSQVMGIPSIQLKSYESRAIGLTGAHAFLLGIAAAIMDDLAGFGTPIATFVNFALIFFLMAVAARFLMLQLLTFVYRIGRDRRKVLIYGAGETGRKLAAALHRDIGIEPVAFVDDDRAKQSTILQGLTVYSPLTLETLVRERNIDRVLLAMPNLSPNGLVQVSRRLKEIGVDARALPSFSQMTGQAPLSEQLRRIPVDSYLGRAPVEAGVPSGTNGYNDRNVLVSGAGGSIGSELCRQVLACKPSRLILFELSEPSLYAIEMELRPLAVLAGVELVPVLGSVADADLVHRILKGNDVQVVVHAAAYKHVPLVEQNVAQGMANNALGTLTLAQAAAEANVERFILISTDKAVRPTNMMGASKRLAEIILQDMASRMPDTGTVFSMVRFGNVMGSSGSVMPLFESQIAKGGPLTLTHPNVTRYFMTIAEAAQLVLVAGSFAEGGDVFVLDMGEPVLIYDLARQMIAAAGYTVRDADNPDGNIDVVLTGLRPGEKVHEELLIGTSKFPTPNPKIMRAREEFPSQIEVAAALKSIRRGVADGDDVALRNAAARYVEEGAVPLKALDPEIVSTS